MCLVVSNQLLGRWMELIVYRSTDCRGVASRDFSIAEENQKDEDYEDVVQKVRRQLGHIFLFKIICPGDQCCCVVVQFRELHSKRSVSIL
jgi:hypothetical protein